LFLRFSMNSGHVTSLHLLAFAVLFSSEEGKRILDGVNPSDIPKTNARCLSYTNKTRYDI
jgi:hypothetical protein